jgi:hypothetical protein
MPSKKEELVANKIVDAAYHVHKNLGSGLLKKIYNVPIIKRATTDSYYKIGFLESLWQKQ